MLWSLHVGQSWQNKRRVVFHFGVQHVETQHVKHNFYRHLLFWFIYTFLFWNFRHRLVRHYWYCASCTMLHLTFAHKRKASGLQRLVLNWWPNRSPSQWAPRCQGLCNFSAWNFWLAQAGLSCKDSLVLHVHMLSVRMGFGSLGGGFETTCWNYLDLLLASNAIGCIMLYIILVQRPVARQFFFSDALFHNFQL